MLGLSQEQLARVVGKKQQNIQQVESGVVKHPRYIRDLLNALHCTYEQLESGHFDEIGEEHGGYEFTHVSEFLEDPRKQGKAPLISWVKAGDADLAIDLLAPGDALGWIYCIAPHSASTFALEVDGDSMTAPYGKSYPNRSIIFVDPEKRGSVETGEAIIAKISGVDKVTFKSLARDDGRLFLKPLNPQYPNMFEEFRVLGKVIGKWED